MPLPHAMGTVEAALADVAGAPGSTLDDLFAADARARAHVRASLA